VRTGHALSPMVVLSIAYRRPAITSLKQGPNMTSPNTSSESDYTVDDGVFITGNIGRRRPRHIPRPESGSYHQYKIAQLITLRNAVNQRNREFTARTGVTCMTFTNDELIIEPNSQSKLSQQELSDLQKATHFDKKELQQWYKGMSAEIKIRYEEPI